MRRLKVDPSGCSINLDHIVMVEKTKEWILAWMVTGSSIVLSDVYPAAHDLVAVSPGVWVNPKHVVVVDVGYNKDQAFRDVMNNKNVQDGNYMQVRLETVLGEKKYVWSDIYGVDELDSLADLLDGWGKE